MKKTMKRRAFISAIAMLIVSAIVLTSSTFAWFSMSKEAQVDNMNLNITTADGISISANTHKFGTTVTTSDIIPTDNAGKNLSADADHTNSVPELLAPVSTDMRITDGAHPVFFKGSIKEDKNVTLAKVTNEKEGGFVVFDLFVQVSKNETVKLVGTTVSSDDENVVKAMRLGIVNCGNKEYSSKDAVKTSASAGATSGALWVVDGNASDSTQYIKNTCTRTSINASSANPSISNDTSYITSTQAGSVCKSADASGLTFNANAGVNRIRIYLWVEGQDPDCINDIAGGNFDFNLKLSID